MKDESQNPWTDPELEARIVALVLGEASDFEREELNRLIEEWPDLASFKEKIQEVLAQGPEDNSLEAMDKAWEEAAAFAGQPDQTACGGCQTPDSGLQIQITR